MAYKDKVMRNVYQREYMRKRNRSKTRRLWDSPSYADERHLSISWRKYNAIRNAVVR